MRCTTVQDRLVLYLAGELNTREASRIIDHTSQCDVCTALAEELAATQERLAAALSTAIEAPESLDARVMRAVREVQGHQTARDGFTSLWRRPMVYATTLGFVLFIALGVSVRGRYAATSALTMASLGKAHNSLVDSALPDQIQRSEPDQLVQQLSLIVRVPIRVANLTAEGAQLVGGNRITVAGEPIAELHYQWQAKQISVFEMESSKRTPDTLRQLGHEPDAYYAHKSGDMAYIAWHSGKTECVMVARSVPMHQLFHLACKACENLEAGSQTSG